MNHETILQNRIMLAIGRRPDVRLFRNTVGVGWVGRLVNRSGGYSDEVVLRNAKRVTFGLAVGSADLIGWREVTVTPEMVGTKIAQFVSMEVKTDRGVVSPEQLTWYATVNVTGGCPSVVKSVKEAEEAV